MTHSQQQLRERMLSKFQGVRVELVYCEYSAGSSPLLRALTHETKDGAGLRVLSVPGHYGAWDAIVMLSRLAGTRGASQTDRIARAFQALSGNGARPLTLAVEDTHFMSTRELEQIVLSVEAAAAELDVPVHLFLFVKQTIYAHKKMLKSQTGELYWGGAWESFIDWPPVPKLFAERQARGRLFLCELRKQGLETLTKTEAREEIAERLALVS